MTMLYARLISLLSALALLAVGAGCTARKAPDVARSTEVGWTGLRGPDRSGVSAATGLLKEWPEGGPELLYTIENVGSGYSSFAIADGRLFTLGKRSDGGFLLAYATADGSPLWEHRIGERYSNDRGGGPRSTPTIDGDRVYTLGPNGDLWAVQAATGEPLWHVQVLERYGGENLRWGLAESPLVVDDKVICSTGDPAGSIIAFDKMTGEIVWQSTEVPDEPAYASGIVADVDGIRQVIYFTDEAIVGVRLSDGKLLWRYEKAANSTANCTMPIYHDGHVFLTSGYDTGAALLRLTRDGDGTRAEEVYFTRDMKNHHGGVILLDDHIYGFSDKTLTCLDFKTGERKWRHRSVGKGAITAADGMLYLLSENGIVGLAPASPESYEESSRFSIELHKRRAWTYPVVHDGRLWVRVIREIRCYDISARDDAS